MLKIKLNLLAVFHCVNLSAIILELNIENMITTDARRYDNSWTSDARWTLKNKWAAICFRYIAYIWIYIAFIRILQAWHPLKIAKLNAGNSRECSSRTISSINEIWYHSWIYNAIYVWLQCIEAWSLVQYICIRTVSGECPGLTDRLEKRNLNYMI